MNKERGILFSAPMVRALLDGRKTQTRRVVKDPQSFACLTGDCPHTKQSQCDVWMLSRCPYGVPGDRLWVRETWKTWERPIDGMDGVIFGADGEFRPIENSEEASDLWGAAYNNGVHGNKWRPSIFMPRWASRITLEITEIRVERLREITEEDANAEGVEVTERGFSGDWFRDYSQPQLQGFYRDPRSSYRTLWDSINAKTYPWSSNPWVWVVTFKRIKP